MVIGLPRCVRSLATLAASRAHRPAGPRRAAGCLGVLERLRVCLAWLAVVFLPASLGAQPGPFTTPGPNGALVVVLHSYDSRYAWVQQVTQGLLAQLEEGARAVDVREEFLDTRRHVAPAHLDQMHGVLTAKYGHVRPAVVVACDGAAVRFLVAHPDLFDRVPVVFGGIDDPALIASLPRARFTGVSEGFRLDGAIDMARRLRPGVRRIIAITSNDPGGDSWRRSYAALSPGTHPPIEQWSAVDHTVAQLLTRLEQETGPDDLVVATIVSHDATGVELRGRQVMQQIAAASRAPVLGLGFSEVGQGVVGTTTNSGELHGRAIARKVREVLDGAPPSAVPLERDDTVRVTLDAVALDRWGIDPRWWPAGAVVANRPPTFYGTYRRVILGGLAFMALQSVAIAGLVLNVRRRRSAERALEAQASALRAANTALKCEQDVRRDAERQLQQAQKMEAVGRLAGGVAHDFNNLLTVIIGYTALLAGKADVSSPEHEAIDQIQKASGQAARLTQDLLAIGRRQLAAPSEVDVVATISAIAPMLRKFCDARVVLTLDLAADTGVVRLGQGQLEQCVVNLVINARDALPDGGRIDVVSRASLVSAAAPVDGLPEGRYAVISVQDNGHGMDEDVRMRVFEPFFTTKPVGRGTGLGLATVHGIVTQARGQVTVESAPDHGARFIIWLPTTTAS